MANKEEELQIRKALVISVSDYSHNLQSLDFAKKDGEEMYKLLKTLGYQISDNHRLIGHVTYDIMRDAIIDFFSDPSTKAEDTLLLYYSGHGIPDVDGDIFLASSETNPDVPIRRSYSFAGLTKMIDSSVSIRIVTILDCCYSGAAKLSKGHEEDAAKLGTAAIDNKARMIQQGEGKCLLAASQAAQEAYALKEGDHSIFTYYLLEGLRGNEKSVDADGNITPYSLGNYVYRSILNLPAKKRPKQKPITKVEASGDIILANYPNLSRPKAFAGPIRTPPLTQPQAESRPSELESSPLSLPSQAQPTKDTSLTSLPSAIKEEPQKEFHRHYPHPPTIGKKESWIRPKILIPIIVGVVVVIVSILGFTFLSGGGNNLPIANAGSPQIVKAGDIVTLDGSKSTDSDGTIISYLWTQSVGPAVLLNSPNTVSPTFTVPNVISDTKLIFDLTAKDNKGAASKPATVELIVKPVKPVTKIPSLPITGPPISNHPPTANDQSVVTSMDKSIALTLTATDQDRNDNLTAAVTSKPLHGTLSEVNQNTGNITYTPNPGFTGTDSFTFKVNDGKIDSNSVGTIKISVNQSSSSTMASANNHPPTANGQSVTTNKNKPVDITLGASDPEMGDSLTAQIVSPPSHGKLSEINQVTGVVTYTPNPGFTGTDKFTFKVNDGKVDSKSMGTISITVKDA